MGTICVVARPVIELKKYLLNERMNKLTDDRDGTRTVRLRGPPGLANGRAEGFAPPLIPVHLPPAILGETPREQTLRWRSGAGSFWGSAVGMDVRVCVNEVHGGES